VMNCAPWIQLWIFEGCAGKVLPTPL